MGQAKQLYELQGIDLEIEKKNQALRTVESQIAESKAISDARSELAKYQQSLSELEKEQRWIEQEIEDLLGKLTVIENKLYSGAVKSPKELTNLQREADNFKAQQRKREDKTLDLMGQVEIARDNIAAKSKELKQIEQEWQHKQQQLLTQQAELLAALTSLNRKRDELRGRIDPASLKLYQTLRQDKHGIAVSKIEQGLCQGCHISLPLTLIQRARAASELIQCSSCRRILYSE